MTKASKKRPTILDVAKASGFKPATVSLALRGDSRIRESTRKHIERIAREQRYVPNTAGRSLCGAKPKVFGLLLTSMDEGYYLPLLEQALQTSESEHHSVSVFFSQWDQKRETLAFRQLVENRVAGIVWAPISVNAARRKYAIELADSAGVPLVILGTDSSGLVGKAAALGIEHDAAVDAGIDYLHRLGHRRIALVAAKEARRNTIQKDRLEFMLAALKKHGLLLHEEDIWILDDDSYGSAAFGKVLCERSAEERPTAVFCADDMQARALILGLELLGLSVPHDISVMGFDGSPICNWANRQLASVSLQAGVQGGTAINLLFGANGINGYEWAETTIIQPLILEGNTCRKI